MEMEAPSMFVTEAEVLRLLGLSRSCVRSLVSRGEFAPCYRLSPGRIAFKRNEVIAWADTRKVAA
jgi:predicted DNA-binding transcriptional regulator AlpA